MQICRIFISGTNLALLKKWMWKKITRPTKPAVPLCQSSTTAARQENCRSSDARFSHFSEGFCAGHHPVLLHGKAGSTQLSVSLAGVFAVHCSLPKKHERNRQRDQCVTSFSVSPSYLIAEHLRQILSGLTTRIPMQRLGIRVFESKECLWLGMCPVGLWFHIDK